MRTRPWRSCGAPERRRVAPQPRSGIDLRDLPRPHKGSLAYRTGQLRGDERALCGACPPTSFAARLRVSAFVRIFVPASCQAAVCHGVAICRLMPCPLTDEPLRPLSALAEVPATTRALHQLAMSLRPAGCVRPHFGESERCNPWWRSEHKSGRRREKAASTTGQLLTCPPRGRMPQAAMPIVLAATEAKLEVLKAIPQMKV